MDLSSPGILFSGLAIGSIGALLFFYGKKNQDLRCLFTGIAMCVFPYFVSSLAIMWLAAAACLGGLYAWSRYE